MGTNELITATITNQMDKQVELELKITEKKNKFQKIKMQILPYQKTDVSKTLDTE